VHLGPVTNPDVCVTIADFFMKIHDIAWVVVSGTFKGQLVIIVRNDGFRKDAGRLLAKVFGHLGTAGGHKAMARAEIPLENLKDEVQFKYDKLLARWVARNINRVS
jgi:nanoRNase/pAp phosphatase (c-di-AMP/oligoRNAs hydrolase)